MVFSHVTRHGTLFLHSGYYKEGVFKFIIDFPREYPLLGPRVRFITPLFHPLVDSDGNLFLDHFQDWDSKKYFVSNLLYYIKACFNQECLSTIQSSPLTDLVSNCFNKNAQEL
jgi:ubiquitin-protein ligase